MNYSLSFLCFGILWTSSSKKFSSVRTKRDSRSPELGGVVGCVGCSVVYQVEGYLLFGQLVSRAAEAKGANPG